ncbi:SGNH hydrolase-type esterase domain-containing protein [Leucosporidium creatinivorum]|uniref:SGNH hydrolase-type esterase domain-containing protein n=1 Tax=Leucosporidium creatinivorum TaxID=106004 RepID=A0A1Y2EQZ0_9BASI|nr:SGNH hydrolase-type esterase domain-containing protein [Leucosporidium creatinivorum]
MLSLAARLPLPLLGLLLPSLAAAAVDSSVGSASSPLLLGNIKTLFAFGDSYTANGYNPGRGFDPEIDQDIHTTSGGDNWAQYLAAAADVEKSFYDFAISGSTIEPIHLNNDPRPNPSLVNETDTFINYFYDKHEVAWDPETTLFMVASGINDIANSVLYSLDYESSVEKLVDIYTEQISRLYTRGARHFLFVTVPPFDRTPLGLDGSHHDEFVSWGHIWNFRMRSMIKSYSDTFPEMEARIWDMNECLTEIIDNAKSLGFADSTSSCWPYAVIRGYEPEADRPDCAHPLAEYVWKDAAHPTWAAHKLMGDSVIALLKNEAQGEVHGKEKRTKRWFR